MTSLNDKPTVELIAILGAIAEELLNRHYLALRSNNQASEDEAKAVA